MDGLYFGLTIGLVAVLLGVAIAKRWISDEVLLVSLIAGSLLIALF